MKNLCRTAYVALFAVTVSSSWAATPDQVGDYEGSYKEKVYQGTTVNTVKSDFRMSIAADNSTTVIINGVTQGPGVGINAFYSGTDGAIVWSDPALPANSATVASVHFKGTSISGVSNSVVLNAGPPQTLGKVSLGKFKVKKVN
jgi:hypothetical protein